jgi:hypothetical protein
MKRIHAAVIEQNENGSLVPDCPPQIYSLHPQLHNHADIRPIVAGHRSMSAFFRRFREKTDIRFVDTVFGDGATAFPSLKLNEHGSYDVLAYLGIP